MQRLGHVYPKYNNYITASSVCRQHFDFLQSVCVEVDNGRDARERHWNLAGKQKAGC